MRRSATPDRQPSERQPSERPEENVQMPEPADTQPAVLRLVGDIDIASESEWRRRGDEFLASHPDLENVVIDMSGVSFLDSRGMAVLVFLHNAAVERGGELTLREVPPRIAKALAVAGLDQIFRLVA
jgi:stage II sporulation protein AA (anti-sigma F factor antagonist)